MESLFARLTRLLTDYAAWAAIGDAIVRLVTGLLGCIVLFMLGRGLIKFLLARAFQPLIVRERASDPQRAARLVTLQAVAASVFINTLSFVVLVILLDTLGVHTASLFATAGVAGVAIGFGAQKLVKDVVTGFLLLLENQFSVGDLVTIGSNTGIVEETGMRVTRLRDEAGRQIILTNGDITQVINYSKGGFRVGVEVGVAADTDRETMTKAVAEAEARLSESPIGITGLTLRGITAMSATALTYRVEAVAPPTMRMAAEAEIRAVLLAVLRSREVKLA